MTERLDLDDDARVLVLTGAGASKDSGIPTFRDADGLWEGHDVGEVASPEGFARNPRLVWKFYSERRRGVLQADPNEGHYALAKLEEQLGDRFLLVTQNVDALHARAGSQRMVEIHGNLLVTRCTTCARAPFVDHDLYLDTLPMCRECDARGEEGILRPHIVWFGEMLDSTHLERIERFMIEAGPRLRFVAVGTSGVVWPAAGLVEGARKVGGRSWLVNAEPADNTDAFDRFVEGRSAEMLPAFLGLV
ncbi:MAG: NAD-dependent deacylase [Sandaracinaceae bacterium]|nr:NAD-dependent deacylase [Sandaracinaceae bacterium]